MKGRTLHSNTALSWRLPALFVGLAVLVALHSVAAAAADQASLAAGKPSTANPPTSTSTAASRSARPIWSRA